MQLERLEMLNFCQYRQKTVDFLPGLSMIVGPNGVGKSNLLGAISYALTGDNPNVGVKAANICQLAEPHVRSNVELRFRHHDRSVVVRRHLRPNDESTLQIEGEPQITGDKRVTARLMEFLEIDANLLNDVVMVAQGQMFGFLSKTPAKRDEAFQRLFRTAKAADVYDAVTKHLSKLEVIDVEQELNQRRQALLISQATVDSLTVLIGTDVPETFRQQVADAQALQHRYAQQKDVNRRRTADEEEVSRLKVTIAAKAIEAQQYAAACQTLEQAAAGVAEAARAATAALATLKHRQQLRQTKASLRDELQAMQHSFASLLKPTKPVVPDNQVVADMLHDAQVQLSFRVGQLRSLVQSFDPQTGVAVCPTCFTPVQSLADKLEEARTQLPELETQLQELNAQLTGWRYFQNAVRLYESQFQQLTQYEASIRQKHDGIDEASTAPVDEVAAKQTVQDFSEYEEGAHEYRLQAASATAAHAQLVDRLTMVENQLARLPDTGAAISDAEFAAAMTTAQRAYDRQLELQRLNAELTREQQLVVGFESQVTALEARHQRSLRQRAWRERCDAFRGLVHREAAPRFVSQRNLQALTYGLNEQLAAFDADFRVEASEGLSYTANFFDGRKQPAERLSHAQKVVLAISFYVALNRVYADVGFLALDEPTAYMDEHYIAGFAPTLERLRQLAAARGLQCLIVTHEERLSHLFDNVIQL